ncbi:hypothetical protein HRbin27_01230 [bacterium HR27]|nr:hypothetical protein HRbin27_01230 [bacterium HR27]
MAEGALQRYLDRLHRMKASNPDRDLPSPLVISEEDAIWLDAAITGNPTRIGVLPQLPTNTLEIFLQEIPPGSATDLQRHAHETVHIVVSGSGYSEIGEATVQWQAGCFIYTPPWAWHRHYNTSQETVRMIGVENSRLLEQLGVARRESLGNITYAERPGASTAQTARKEV